MPRSKQGIKRPPVNKVKLAEAVTAVLQDDGTKISLREASKVYNIPIATLCRHLRAHKEKGSAEFQYESHLDVKRIFSKQEERSLVDYIKKIAQMHYGLTKKGVRELAFKYAKANNNKMPLNWETNQIAGDEWIRGFMKRHGNELSIRKPEATSLARASSFNKTNYDKFMTNLEDIHRRFGPIPPERIWNLDESGCTTVQAPSRIVAPKGVKQLGSMTSAERGQLVTVICAVSATGNHVPPMMIFPRVKFKEHMIIGAPPGTLGSANPSGWSNDEQFTKFMGHFIKHVKPTPEEPVLLILDGHESHCGVEVVEMAAKRGIKMLTFPPHTSGRLQPLDLTIFGPFKTFYNQALEAWHTNHPGKTFDIYNVAEAVGLAFSRAFTTTNICSGFRRPGIFPLNRAAFCDDDFAPASVTDRPNPEITSNTSPLPGPSSDLNPRACSSGTQNGSLSQPFDVENQLTNTPQTSMNRIARLTPEEVHPFPKAPPRKQTKRKAGTTKILTDTPVKETLRSQKVTPKLNKGKNKEPAHKKKKKKSKKEAARRALFDSSDEDTEDPSYQEESDVEGKTLKELLSSSGDDDEEIPPPEIESIGEGTYILVTFFGKRDVVCYVGCVTKKLSEGEFEVSYLRKTVTNFFCYPTVPDIASVDQSDIVAVLPSPTEEGTDRAKGKKCFRFPFHKFNVK